MEWLSRVEKNKVLFFEVPKTRVEIHGQIGMCGGSSSAGGNPLARARKGKRCGGAAALCKVINGGCEAFNYNYSCRCAIFDPFINMKGAFHNFPLFFRLGFCLVGFGVSFVLPCFPFAGKCSSAQRFFFFFLFVYILEWWCYSFKAGESFTYCLARNDKNGNKQT